MLVLFETPAGFALFKVVDEGKLSQVEDLWKEFTTSESARKMLHIYLEKTSAVLPVKRSAVHVLVCFLTITIQFGMLMWHEVHVRGALKLSSMWAAHLSPSRKIVLNNTANEALKGLSKTAPHTKVTNSEVDGNPGTSPIQGEEEDFEDEGCTLFDSPDEIPLGISCL